MVYQHISVQPLTPTIGAVVSGIDLGAPSAEAFAEIKRAWLEHLVLFFCDQTINPEQHLKLGHMLGELHIHPAAPYRDDNPALMAIYAGPDSHRNNGDTWHSDVSADEEPPMASILYLQTAPEVGGDTLWANMYAAYEALSSPVKALLGSLSAKHSANYTGYYGDHEPQRKKPQRRAPRDSDASRDGKKSTVCEPRVHSKDHWPI